MSDEVDVEYRVTGQPRGYPPYHFVWTGPNAEREARGFLALHDRADLATEWIDGPHLHRRTVTRTPWENA